MEPLTITAFAERFGLSRSTLLYYDRIGLLNPGGVSASGYRLYGEKEVLRMQRVDTYRKAGLPLKAIKEILDETNTDSLEQALEQRLLDLNQEIAELKSQQVLLGELLRRDEKQPRYRSIGVDEWVAMLEEAGVDEEGRRRWHQAFERDAPDSHQQFLQSLGLSEKEVREIRKMSLSK